MKPGLAIRTMGKQRALSVILERDAEKWNSVFRPHPALGHRIGSPRRIARSLQMALDEPSRREGSAKTKSINLGGLGATMPGGESVSKIRETRAPPRKYPPKSAP